MRKPLQKNGHPPGTKTQIRRCIIDIQLKRGLLDVCVLASIKNEDSYGYKIMKDVKPYLELSESTLYTILKRLEAAHMLTVKTMTYSGRLRKYYHITENGIARLNDFENDWQEMLRIHQFITDNSQPTKAENE